jgi:nitrate reductase NapE component
MESGTVTALRERHIKTPVNGCAARRELVSKTTTIKFGQVAGLWVILAIAMLGAFGATGFMLVTRRFRAKQRAKLKRATSVNFSRRPSGLA